MLMDTGHQIESRADALQYILGGDATFTVVSKATGTRFTYRVAKGKADDAPHFVSVLVGSDNTTDYLFLGTIFERRAYRRGWKSPIPFEAPSQKAFWWLWTKALGENKTFAQCEFWHHGSCSRCGRCLTDPESIKRGLGPVCYEKAIA